jgi:hypothetical protein
MSAQPSDERDGSRTRKALPKGKKLSDSGQPEGYQGRVDITGIMPEDVRVDPEVTEGHPGYEESGGSEIIPPERLARGATDKEKGKAD